MFLKIYLKSLRNNEFIQFLRNIIQIVLDKDPAKLNVETPCNDLKRSVDLMDDKHKSSKGERITAELVDIDESRDNSIRGIIANLNSYKNHFKQEYRDASECLLRVVNRYEGDIAKYSYQYETNAIDDIIGIWKKENECVAALSTLSITDWANKLEEDNSRFNSKFLDRVQIAAENSDIKIVELRKEIGDKYNKLLQFISAYATINPSPEYTETIDLINALIKQYEKTINIRAAKRAAGEDVEETEDNTLS